MKLKKLKLNELSKTELNEREMCRILGGCGSCCQCGCLYEGTPGGSTTSANNAANTKDCLTSAPTEGPDKPTPTPGITLGSICEPSHPADPVCYGQDNTCF